MFLSVITYFYLFLIYLLTGQTTEPILSKKNSEIVIDSVINALPKEGLFIKTRFFLSNAKGYYLLNDFSNTLREIDSAIKYVSPLTHPIDFRRIINYGVNISNLHSNYKKKIQYLEILTKSGICRDVSADLGNIYIQIADCYLNIHLYEKSIYYCNKAYPIFKKENDIKSLVHLYIKMYNNLFLYSNDSTGYEYIEIAQKIADSTKDSLLQSELKFNIGKYYYRNKQYSNAIYYYRVARDLVTKKGSDQEIIIAIFQHLAYTYMQDSVEHACSLNNYILTSSLKNNKLPLLGNAYLGKANCFAKKGQKDSAEYYLDLSEHYRLLYGKPESSQGYYYKMYEVSLIAKSYERALRYLNTSYNQKLESISQNNDSILMMNRMQLDYKIQRDKINELKFINQSYKKSSIIRRYIAIFIILILLIAITTILVTEKRHHYIFSIYKLFRKIRQKITKSENDSLLIRDEELIYERIKKLLAEKKIYRDSDLSLQKLSSILDTNTTYLSIIINKKFGDPFKTVLNRFRIEEAKNILSSDQINRYTIDGIAKSVGYNSRSAFYSSFRQITGMSPKEFLLQGKR